jgi:hypothetical protein
MDSEPSPAEILLLLAETGVSDYVVRGTGANAPSVAPADGFKFAANPGLYFNRLMVVATEEVKSDLGRLIPTALAFTNLSIHIVGDSAACRMAEGIGRFLGGESRIHLHPWITPESLIQAAEESAAVTAHSAYWKVGPIWWKLRGMLRLFEESEASVFLVDSDIVFTGLLKDLSWPGTDLVLSPFHWTGDVALVPVVPGSVVKHPLPSVHGNYNAGYLLAGRGEVAEEWMRLYRAGIGGFYEQACLAHLSHRFEWDVFGTAHNWGIWRKSAPRKGTVSVHRHAETPCKGPIALAIEKEAQDGVDRAYRLLGKELA